MNERAAIASVRRIDGAEARVDHDLVAVEAPLTVDVVTADGVTHPLGVVMRTPGDDRDLVLGLLCGESLVRRLADVTSIDLSAGEDGDGLARARLSPAVSLEGMPAARRQLLSSACGLCGRLSLELLDACAPRTSAGAIVFRREIIAAIPASLRSAQPVFAETGGLHAAALFDAAGRLTHLREDVGRHNAVDKVVGAALAAGALDAARGLAVSGRVAYEIVQKASLAGLSVIVAVGAPSSLAVQAARAAGVTLVGFVRDGRFNVYSGVERIAD